MKNSNVIDRIKKFSRNIFEYAAINERVMEAMMRDMSGRERKTTFFSDLSIAEWCEGANGVKDTYKRVMKSCIGNLDYILEFILCLNWKGFQHAEDGNKDMCRLYSELWEKGRDKVYDHYTDDEDATAKILRYLD